jgi:predicted HicB family RNase H-like nuclease
MKPKKIKEKREIPRRNQPTKCFILIEGELHKKLLSAAKKNGFSFWDMNNYVRAQLKKNLK